jgi:hypothetical protein
LQGVVREVLDKEPFSHHGEGGLDGPLFRLDVAGTIAVLNAAGCSVVSAEIKTFIDCVDTAQTVIDFSASSSLGNFLGKLPAAAKLAAIEAVQAALEARRPPQGHRTATQRDIRHRRQKLTGEQSQHALPSTRQHRP